MSVYHLRADEDGESVLVPLELPQFDSPMGAVRGLSDVPVSALGLAMFVDRKTDGDIHPAPRRQFVVVLRGEMEIETARSGSHRLQPGDVMLADDVRTPGHHTRDVGEVPLGLMNIPVGDGWVPPGS
jgi:hypothetical protein